jgi:hypothetical protein
MVGGRLGLRRVAVALEVGGDDGEVIGEPRGDLVSHSVGLRVAVELIAYSKPSNIASALTRSS